MSILEENPTAVVTATDGIKHNPEARHNLASALLDDERSRLASQQRSRDYLLRKYTKPELYPYWETAFQYFLFGALFAYTMDGLAWNWIHIMEYFMK